MNYCVIRLEDIDNSLREVFARKDGLSTPHGTEDHTPSVSPHTSPQSRRRQNDRLLKASPTQAKKAVAMLTTPSWHSQSIDSESVMKRSHKRQFSDSVTLPVYHVIQENEKKLSIEEVSKEDISDELMIRREHSLSTVSQSDSVELPSNSSASDIRIAKSSNSSTDNVTATTGAPATVLLIDDATQQAPLSDSGNGIDGSDKVRKELQLALVDDKHSDYMPSVLHIDDTDILSKLRGTVAVLILFTLLMFLPSVK